MYARLSQKVIHILRVSKSILPVGNPGMHHFPSVRNAPQIKCVVRYLAGLAYVCQLWSLL